jgi:hypothetical protein
MQTYLKISFWFSLIVLVLGGFLLCDCYKLFLSAAALALPGFLVKNWPYKIMSLLVVCFALAEAYDQFQRSSR